MALLHLVVKEAGRQLGLEHGESALEVAGVVAGSLLAKRLGAGSAGGDAAAPGHGGGEDVLAAPGYAERDDAFVAAGGMGQWLSCLLSTNYS